MTLPLMLLTTAAGLLALAVWWFRPIIQAYAAELALEPERTAPVPPGLADPDCGIGIALMASAAGGATGGGGSGTTTKPKRKKPTGPDRRQFLRNAWLVSWGGVLGAFGLSVIGFMWPRISGGFGATIPFGDAEDIVAEIRANGGRFEYPAGRLYLVEYDESQDPDGVYAELNAGAPVMALYQKCVHLGCRVPWCDTSKWFECPCHGSRYNTWGEYEFGPAPRGLDRFPLEYVDGQVSVITAPATIVEGPPRDGGVYPVPQAGPNCN